MRALYWLMLVATLAALPPPPLECFASDMCSETRQCCDEPASCPLLFTCAPTDQNAEQPVRTDVRPITTIAAIPAAPSVSATVGRVHVAPPRALPESVPRWLLYQSLIV
jgi:hypothetical protein